MCTSIQDALNEKEQPAEGKRVDICKVAPIYLRLAVTRGACYRQAINSWGTSTRPPSPNYLLANLSGLGLLHSKFRRKMGCVQALNQIMQIQLLETHFVTQTGKPLDSREIICIGHLGLEEITTGMTASYHITLFSKPCRITLDVRMNDEIFEIKKAQALKEEVLQNVAGLNDMIYRFDFEEPSKVGTRQEETERCFINRLSQCNFDECQERSRRSSSLILQKQALQFACDGNHLHNSGNSMCSTSEGRIYGSAIQSSSLISDDDDGDEDFHLPFEVYSRSKDDGCIGLQAQVSQTVLARAQSEPGAYVMSGSTCIERQHGRLTRLSINYQIPEFPSSEDESVDESERCGPSFREDPSLELPNKNICGGNETRVLLLLSIKMKLILLAASLAICCFIPIGVIFGLKAQGVRKSNTANTIMDWEVLLQTCQSFDRGTRLSSAMGSEIMTRYYQLREELLVGPMQGGMNEDDCSPKNLALYSIALLPTSRGILRSRFILSAIFFALDGNLWINRRSWLTSKSYCDWSGISCGTGEEVVGFTLIPSPRTRAEVPEELFELTSLTYFSVVGSFVGTLSPKISKLRKIEYLDIASSQHGPLPTELGYLTELTSLRLKNSFFSGTLPTEIGLMNALTEIVFYLRGITGEIPTEIGKLNNLSYLFYNGSFEIKGENLQNFFRLKSLKTLSLGEGKIIGNIPSTIGLQTQLRNFQLKGMGITGELPSEIGLCTGLSVLSFSRNFLIGTIPRQLSKIQSLRSLDLSDNNFSGSIPSELAALTNLNRLNLAIPLLRGTIPQEICSSGSLHESVFIGCRDGLNSLISCPDKCCSCV